MPTDTGTISTHLAPGQPAFTTATPTGGLVPENPLPKVPAALIWSQPYQVDRGSYSAPTLNATNPTYTSAYLIGDTAFGGEFDDTLTFTRRWATIPATWVDFEYTAITYPGQYDALANKQIRRSYTQTVAVRVTRDYYLVGPGQTYTTADQLPLATESRVTDTNGLNAPLLSGVDLTNGENLDFNSYETTPSIADYNALVDDDNSYPSSYSLVLSSIPEPYYGNIWCVVTREVKAR